MTRDRHDILADQREVVQEARAEAAGLELAADVLDVVTTGPLSEETRNQILDAIQQRRDGRMMTALLEFPESNTLHIEAAEREAAVPAAERRPALLTDLAQAKDTVAAHHAQASDVADAASARYASADHDCI